MAEGLRAGAAERDRTGQLAAETFGALKDAGATAYLVPAEHGGGGRTFEDTGQLLRRLARDDGATAVTLAMHTHLVAAQVWRWRHGIVEAEGVLRKVAAGAVLISTGAADWVGSSGTCRRVQDGYVVSARKGPASGCEVGDVLVTSIRWDEAPDGPSVLHCAIPFSAAGLRIEPTWDALGLRATGSHTVALDDVFVPDAAVSLIRAADRWHPVWNMVMGAAMPLIMAAYLGIADAALALARDAVAAGSEPDRLHCLGETINAHTTAADVVAAMLASADDLRFDNTDEHAAATLSRKSVATDAVIATCRHALETVGGRGYRRGHDAERLLRDAHGCLFHPLPRARQLAFSARVAIGQGPLG
ncbi:MAG: acyl-CoA/acyl-ACP dehydrogenase [Acidimicrobiales bacterium]|nr:acyl-CoA/acyl-ACP dehydrogenase [Acidimicrobiales bacterium]